MKFTGTPVPNLVKGENGTYYARVRLARAKLVWRSLETKSFNIAKLKLPDKVAELRGAGSASLKLDPKSTVGQVIEVYESDVNADPRLKPRAKEFRLRFKLTLRRTWPDLFGMELRRVKAEACKGWLLRFENGDSKFRSPRAHKFRAGNSATTVNGLIAFLRRIFDYGIRAGIIYQNPAKDLVRKPPQAKLLRLPSRTQFAQIVAHLRSQFGWGSSSADLVEGLAYSGMRVGEARRLTWGHLDFEKGMFVIPGEKTDSAPRIVPMTPDFRGLMLKVRDKTEVRPDAPIFRTQTALESLKSACRIVGASHMTHHDLRHLFATTCIEAGVDIPTVSRWLGHADGGALAMKTYGHLRPEHSVAAAKKVIFTPAA